MKTEWIEFEEIHRDNYRELPLGWFLVELDSKGDHGKYHVAQVLEANKGKYVTIGHYFGWDCNAVIRYKELDV